MHGAKLLSGRILSFVRHTRAGRRFFRVALTGLLVLGAAAIAAAQPAQKRVLVLQSPVFMGDRIRTGSAGEAQPRFRDQTRRVVGAPTRHRQLRPQERDVGEGRVDQRHPPTFRFITGDSPTKASTRPW